MGVVEGVLLPLLLAFLLTSFILLQEFHEDYYLTKCVPCSLFDPNTLFMLPPPP